MPSVNQTWAEQRPARNNTGKSGPVVVAFPLICSALLCSIFLLISTPWFLPRARHAVHTLDWPVGSRAGDIRPRVVSLVAQCGIALAGSPYPWLAKQIVGARQGFFPATPCDGPSAPNTQGVVAYARATLCVASPACCTNTFTGSVFSKYIAPSPLNVFACPDLGPLLLSLLLENLTPAASLNSSPRCWGQVCRLRWLLFPKKSLRRAAKSAGRPIANVTSALHVEGAFGHCRKEKEWVLVMTCYAGGALAPWSNSSCKVQARFVRTQHRINTTPP
jgi:hypothetical protein